jgi:hypothetical protein
MGEFTLTESAREVPGAPGAGSSQWRTTPMPSTTRRSPSTCASWHRWSDERSRFVPGLEFGCVQRMHIVGYGVTRVIDSDDPETVIAPSGDAREFP